MASMANVASMVPSATMAASTPSSQAQQGPPYIPKTAMPGLHPNVSQDVAACAVFVAIYLASAIAHQTLFQLNRRKGHYFPMSWAMFGFGMARVGTMVLRLAWATRPDNARLAIAALIFINVGVLVIYVVVLNLATRLLRARQPRIGWHPMLAKCITANYVFMVIFILLVIAFTILSFYTRNPTLLQASLWIQRTGILYFLIFNLIAPILYFLAVLLPRSHEAEQFGTGSMSAKITILGIIMFFNLWISGFRMGTSWTSARPLTDPAWFDTRAAFYIIELGFEIIITYLMLITRFDKRFWVPNGSKKHGDYSRISPNDAEHRKMKVAELDEATDASSEKSNKIDPEVV